MGVLVVTGAGTGVGKTVVTAALAALARSRGARVAVVKPAQTGVASGEPGDLEAVRRLAEVDDLHEHGRFPEALSPEAAARRAGLPPVDLHASAVRVRELARRRDLVLVEGAGGLLVRYDRRGTTIADLAAELAAPAAVVVPAGLGTLNATALTLEALERRGLALAGVVIGAWPAEPGAAARSNADDLETIAGQALAGAMPEGAGRLDPERFLGTARTGLCPALGGEFEPDRFTRASVAPEAAVGRSRDMNKTHRPAPERIRHNGGP